MNKILAILGAGELGKQIANFALNDQHYAKVIFYDDISKEADVEGDSTALLNDYSKKKFDELIIGIGYNHLSVRREKFDCFFGKIPFGTIIHSSCWVDASAVIKEGCVIYPNSSIDKNVQIDHNSLLNLNCTIAHDTLVGAHSFLAPTVSIAGFCRIGEENFLGIGTILKDNIALSDFVKTGAGTVIIKDIEEAGLYVGNPARKL